MTALERIAHKDSQTLYKKVGRKYIKVNDVCAYDGLRAGYWLVKVADGYTSIKSTVYPAKVEVEAAIRDKVEDILPIIREASEARPQNTPITPELKADWEAMVKKHGDGMRYFTYESMQGMAEKIVEKLVGNLV
jgi:hypothetical protein